MKVNACGLVVIALCGLAWIIGENATAESPDAAQASDSEQPNADWNQWGGSSVRNNTPVGRNIPTEWEIGEFDYRTGEWNPEGAKNIKWVARLGSQSYGNPVVTGGKVFVGTNNSAGWLKRYPGESVDLGVLLAFEVNDGKFLWQHSSEKLPTGRVHDWPMQGICSAVLAEGDRLWFVTSRGEVRCLDTEGFHDDENDGPYKDESVAAKDEADVVWVLDMMKELSVEQHNMASCSLTGAGDLLFVCTSNGVDFEHNYIPAPQAPSFFVVNKRTKDILWTDASPGQNILHGQWSSPSYGEIGGVPQLLFGGGDGFLYIFSPSFPFPFPSPLLFPFSSPPLFLSPFLHPFTFLYLLFLLLLSPPKNTFLYFSS